MRQAVAVQLERIAATRYVTPLREGGSLPALVEADDDGLYVLKFRGAGQGRKALVAEVVAGELARTLDLLGPRLALVELDPVLGRDPANQTVVLMEPRRTNPFVKRVNGIAGSKGEIRKPGRSREQQANDPLEKESHHGAGRTLPLPDTVQVG